MVLYGYAKGKENDPSLGLALSGLRIGELSYGKQIMYSYKVQSFFKGRLVLQALSLLGFG